jgi:hypothetical protein
LEQESLNRLLNIGCGMALGVKFQQIDKEMEDKLLAFSCSIKTDMEPKDVLALYDSLEKEHWLCESKLILMRTLFQSTLGKQFEKEQEAEIPQIFR